MKAAPSTAPQEPIGIIISPGAAKDAAPARFAYIWAPPPEDKGDEARAAS
jgi:hypothetical protein